MSEHASARAVVKRCLVLLAFPLMALEAGCHGAVQGMGAIGGMQGSGGAGGLGGSGNTAGVGGSTSMACTGSGIVAKKRLVRLSFNQVTSSIRVLLGNAIADKVATDFEIVDARHRSFPPLANPREGGVVTDTVWDIGDRIGQEVGQYVLDNFATVTTCATATDACAQSWLATFAAGAFRRPLTAQETAELITGAASPTQPLGAPYLASKTAGLTVQQATQYSVYAVMVAPQFLYRTEFGDDWMTPGALSPYELASEISYFLTDGPPDVQLTMAAAQGMLATAAQVTAHVDRILATDAAKANLEGAMIGYFALPTIETIVIDTGKFPQWNPGLRNSLQHESELFIRNVLWKGKMIDLLTSRQSSINATLAAFYGVAPFPPAGAQLDADGFGIVTLPDNRSGILTQPGFLVARARPTAGSVVGRGLLVNAAFLCVVNPAFPTNLADMIAAVNTMLADATERDKAAYRSDTTHVCSSCHPNFDPYGLALENYDTIGRYRMTDELGRAIDASVKLPPAAGGATVANAVAMAEALAGGDAFAKCITKNLLGFALAETAVTLGTNSCAIRNITDPFTASGDGTFAALVRGIALSQTLAARLPGGAQ